MTGGSEGIGFGITHTLLSHNIAKMFVVSMRKEVADKAEDAIAEEFGQETRDKFIWLQCDLSDWKAVKELGDTISSQTDRLDILVNNAGRGIMTQQFAPTNGIDLHMAQNRESAR